MSVAGFQPRYLQESELKRFGLPTPSQQANIMQLVEQASSLIDEECGRVETDASGSLVYSTYTERLHLSKGRNVVRVSYSPLVALSESTVNTLLAASGTVGTYSGVTPNTISYVDGRLSPVISIKGRYGYGRRGDSWQSPDINSLVNIFQIAQTFGAAPRFQDVDVTNVDFDLVTGELWVPAGSMMAAYSEVEVTYNAGFDPRAMPVAIKHACCNMVKNFLAKPATGIRSVSGAGKVNILMKEADVIDDVVKRYLQNYTVVLAI